MWNFLLTRGSFFACQPPPGVDRTRRTRVRDARVLKRRARYGNGSQDTVYGDALPARTDLLATRWWS